MLIIVEGALRGHTGTYRTSPCHLASLTCPHRLLAIVVALRQRSDDAQSAEDMLRLHTFLFPTLIAFFFSFVPELLSLLGLKIYLVWQISNGLIGVVKLGNLISFNRIQARLHQKLRPILSLQLPGLAIILAHFAAAFGFIPWQEFVYILGLIWPLVLGISMFVSWLGINPNSPSE